VLFPGKIFQFPENLARHRSTEKKGDKEAEQTSKRVGLGLQKLKGANF